MNRFFWVKQNLILLFIALFVFSCKPEEEKKPELVEWNFMEKSFVDNVFGNNRLNMLCMYDTFELKQLDDSLITIHLEIFKGWDQKWEPFLDTLKLTQSTFKTDSIGNTIEQKLKFKKHKEIDFELIITQKSGVYDSIKFYDYTGKLSIKTKIVDYICEEWYVK